MKSALNPSALYWASFNYFDLRLPGQAVLDIAQPGHNDEAVERWKRKIKELAESDNFNRAPTAVNIRKELRDSGGWIEDDLWDDETNWRRVVWLAAHNIAEEEAPDCSPPCKN